MHASGDHTIRGPGRTKRVPTETLRASIDRHGFKCDRVWQFEHKGGGDVQFLYHRFGDWWKIRADVRGLCQSGGLRLRKKLAPIRGVRDSLIRVADPRRGLRIRYKGWRGYSLPRPKIMGGPRGSDSDKLEFC